MTTEIFSQSYNGMNKSVEIIYPTGCNPYSIDFDWNSKFQNEGIRYLPEHRTYPGKSELFNNLTSRDMVYTSRSEMGDQYRRVLSNCPHGTHGKVETRYYYSALAPSGLFDFDYHATLNRKLWSDALRRSLQKGRVNLSSSVAEYKESVRLFYRTALAFRDIYRVLKLKGLPKKSGQNYPKVTIGAIPASILQYNFGVAPLVSDLYSVVEALRLKLTAPILVRSSVSINRKRTKLPFKSAGWSYNLTDSFQQRATIYYDMDPSQYLSQYTDFGNPIEWAWELIPFSFMVDWLIPVGGWLGNLDALTGMSNIRGVVVTKLKQRWVANWDEANVINAPFTGSYQSYQRDVINSIPIGAPRWKPSGGWMKLLNASSILASIKLNGNKFFVK